MGSGSGGQAAMTAMWVILAVLAVSGFAVVSVLRRRGQRSGAGKTGGDR